MSDIKNGDRVRLTVEGTASGNGAYTILNGDAGEWFLEYKNQYVGNGITVEKIKPPVVTFKRGDVVRSKDVPEFCYAITKDGYTDLFNGLHNICDTKFTSEHYELVNLS